MKKVLTVLLILALLISLYVIKTQKDDKLNVLQLLEVNLNRSNKNIDEGNKSLLHDLERNVERYPELFSPYYKRAKEAKNISDSFVRHIENIKRKLVGKEQFIENISDQISLLNESNTSLDVKFFNKKRTEELLNKVASVRKRLLNLLNNGIGAKFNPRDTLKISKQPLLLATRYKLKQSSLVEVITELSKMQNDCRNLEVEVIELLSKSIDADIGNFTICFDEAKVIANSNAVMVGSEYRAEVFLIDFGRNSDYQVIVDGKPLPMENGVGIYTARPTKQGVYKWGGVIKIKINGERKEYPFGVEYQAFQVGASVIADAENVLYIGLDNPLSIMVPGYSPADIIPTISNGGLIKRANSWIAKVYKGGNAVITTSVWMKDGSLRKYGERIFRVKNIPTPESNFGSYKNGRYKTEILLKQKYIIAGLSNFQLEGVKFKVVKYSCSYYPKEGVPKYFSIIGSEITAQMKEVISKAKTSDKIIIDEIMAEGPGGEVKLAPIVLTIQN